MHSSCSILHFNQPRIVKQLVCVSLVLLIVSILWFCPIFIVCCSTNLFFCCWFLSHTLCWPYIWHWPVNLDLVSDLALQECTISLRCGDSDSSGEKVTILKQDMKSLRDLWEQTSFQLELAQCKRECVVQEQSGMAGRRSPPYKLSFNSEDTKTRLTLPGTFICCITCILTPQVNNNLCYYVIRCYTNFLLQKCSNFIKFSPLLPWILK